MQVTQYNGKYDLSQSRQKYEFLIVGYFFKVKKKIVC